jgi:transposase
MAAENNDFLAMRARLAALLPRLNERDRRAAMATEAASWGRGGISAVHRATGASRTTIRRGMTELAHAGPTQSTRRIRAPGAGRKKAEVANPALLDALDSLIRGDQQSLLRWTTKSTRNLAEELTTMGHPVSHSVVAKILGSLGYSLQRTRKTPQGQRPDRDAQFRYTNRLAEQLVANGDPVISIDTEENTNDSAWVSIGVYHDTSVFAVATIEHWWHTMGKHKYPDTRRILITAPGGSHGHRPWRWKFELARLAATTGLDIIVCHCPPGTRKWNRIEHRLFSRITYNWRGSPKTYQTTVTLIAHTRCPASPTAHCKIGSNFSLTKIKLTDQQKKSIPLARHQFHGDWNYTIRPPNLTSREAAEPRWPRHPLADPPARHAPSWPAAPAASAKRTEANG